MKKTILLVVLFVASTVMYSQKMKVKEGDIKNLKDITAYNLIFDYSDLSIHKYDSEEAFLKDKAAKREEKEKGLGEKFKKTWFSDREEFYHPKFIESFNKRFDEKRMVKVSKGEDAKYVMKIHTTKMYAGYNVGIVRHNAEIDAEVIIYEKGNPSNILLQGTYKDVQGNGAMGYDFNSGYRISECYAKLAKNIALFILKKAK